MPLILGLETSCDETAAAVVADGRRVLSNVIASQHDLHRQYGGVVPEIASRAHLERLTPVLREALAQAGVTLAQIDAIAVGNRPGLIGSLLVGVSAAQALAWSLSKPLIGIDHIRAHLYAPTMELHAGGSDHHRPAAAPRGPESDAYPALGLVVSGGHTTLYFLSSPTDLRLLGRTIDDAVGEAYDKAAVILDIGYPGGPKLDRLAQQGDPRRVQPPLPRSLLEGDSLDFSFSGLKTALLYRVRGRPVGRGTAAHFPRSAADLTDTARADLAAAFQEAAVDTLILKLQRALERLHADGQPPRALLLGGGVSANSLLRRRFLELACHHALQGLIPPMPLCLDNAAMIAGLAFEYFRAGRFDSLDLPARATTATPDRA